MKNALAKTKAECLFYYLKNMQSMQITLGKKATIHQVTTILTTSKNVLYPGQNHLLITGADDPTL